MTREEAIADIRDNIKPIVGGKSLDMAIEALEQEPCEMTAEEYRQRMIQAFHNADCDELIALVVLPTEKEFEHLGWLLEEHYKAKPEPCENIGNIYKCSCGYGWDKSKVVRHHFCPNCGRAVDSTELEPCTDAISRQAVLDVVEREQFKGDAISEIEKLPPVKPQTGHSQPKMGRWIRELIRNEKGGCIGAKMICSECGNDNKHDEYMSYCPNCGKKMQKKI